MIVITPDEAFGLSIIALQPKSYKEIVKSLGPEAAEVAKGLVGKKYDPKVKGCVRCLSEFSEATRKEIEKNKKPF